ncbi:MAG: amino acid ABC transporter substrate-binding protein, partial [Rhodobacterales bacterium CG_4_10_14_0_8_um_filter_70_9]
MKRTLIAAVAVAVAGVAPGAQAQAVKFGLLGGISGPIAALAPAIIDASKLAFNEVNAQGGLLDGRQIETAVG